MAMDFETKICSVCGKEFIPAAMHMYKVKTKSGTEYQCGYTCWRTVEDFNKIIHKNLDIKNVYSANQTYNMLAELTATTTMSMEEMVYRLKRDLPYISEMLEKR